MTRRRKPMALIALLLAMSLVAAACGGDDNGGTGGNVTKPGDAQIGGTLIFGAEQEPSEGLNYLLACCTLFWANVIIGPTLAGAFEVQPDFTYAPDLIEADPVITEDPFTLTYKIRDEATWNDGTPVSADDFEFTWQTYVNEKNNVASRAGYEIITKADKPDDKTITFTFSEPYSAYRDLFDPIFPKHALDGENFNKAWADEIVNPKTGESIASGPFQFESYNKGSDLTLVRNESYWGEHTAYLDSIVFKFTPETSQEIQALRGAEVDAIYPQPQLELSSLTTEPSIEVQSGAGTTWEHIDFQFNNDLLAQDFVRQAIAQGIDRTKLTGQLFKDLSPDLEPLNNLIFVSNQNEYEAHFDQWAFDPAAAMATLEDNGCTKGGGGIYECDGEPLSFSFKSTAGNALRELAFQVIEQDLKAVGIEVKNDFGEAAVVFGSKGLVGMKYDLFMFAWVGSPDPGGSVEIWKCEGSQNFMGYCNEDATKLLEETNRTLDATQRAALFNQADELMSNDIPSLPLYQKPTFFAFNIKLKNGVDNPASQQGPTWNAVEWWIEE